MTNRYDALIAELESEKQTLSDQIATLKKMRDGKAPKPPRGVAAAHDEPIKQSTKRHARGSVKLGMLQALEAGNKSSADIQAFLADSGIEKTIAAIGASMFAFKKDGLIKTPSAGVYVLAAAGKKYLKENQESA